MGNVGKAFESAIKESMPDYVLTYRLPDPASAFSGQTNLRFSKKNPFDFLVWNPITKTLYALELKTVAGKSVSFERSKDDKGDIHKHQIDGLSEWGRYDGVVAGFIIEFRNEETTVFLDIDSFKKLTGDLDKKSFNTNDLKKSGLPYAIIPQEKLRVRYRYNMDQFLNEVTSECDSKEDK